MLSSQVHRLIRTFPQNSRTRVSDFGYTLQNVGPGFTLVALRSLTFSLVHPHEKISKRDYTYHCTSNKIFSFCIKLSKLFTHIHTNLFRKKWNLKQVWSNFNIWMRSSKTTRRKHIAKEVMLCLLATSLTFTHMWSNSTPCPALPFDILP